MKARIEKGASLIVTLPREIHTESFLMFKQRSANIIIRQAMPGYGMRPSVFILDHLFCDAPIERSSDSTSGTSSFSQISHSPRSQYSLACVAHLDDLGP